jgi:hypothetical protein
VGISKHQLASAERRVKRMAGRHNYSLLKAQKPFGKVLEHGGYMLRNDYTFEVVFGDKGYAYSADLEDVEAYLESLRASEKD